jgi:type IV secretion system protein VirB2
MIKKESFTFSKMSSLQSIMLCLCVALVLTLLFPNISLATTTTPTSSGGSGDAIATVLCTIVNALQGGIGKAVATIAIVVLGIGLFLGKLSWPLAVATAIGIGMIFGASELVGWISTGTGGSGAGACAAS